MPARLHLRDSLPFTKLACTLALIAIMLASGCATRRPAPVEERPPIALRPAPGVPAPSVLPAAPAPEAPMYQVKRGDTLFQIALDNGLDYRELAAWNNIENANLIRVGQMLRLTPPGETALAVQSPDGVVTAPLRSAPPVSEARPSAQAPQALAVPRATPSTAPGNLKTAPKAVKEPYSDKAVRDMTLAATAVPAPETLAMASPSTIKPETRPDVPRLAPVPQEADEDHLEWAWPAKGKVVAGFSDAANLKGIDIAGAPGDPVVASAAGKVVYAGSGLRGYGKLVIIKHNKTYLSAYAHNREILVKEGQQVARGQKIAEMGSTDADQVMLHFEIRRLGKPMDPTRFLPTG